MTQTACGEQHPGHPVMTAMVWVGTLSYQCLSYTSTGMSSTKPPHFSSCVMDSELSSILILSHVPFALGRALNTTSCWGHRVASVKPRVMSGCTLTLQLLLSGPDPSPPQGWTSRIASP